MSDSTTNLDQISVSQSQKEVTANQNFAAAWPAFAFARHDSASAALTWAYYGGNFNINDSPRTLTRIADGTIALTASATNYLYLSGAGVVTKTTSIPAGWPGPLANGAVALYTVITNGSGINPAAWPTGGFRDWRPFVGSGSISTGGGGGAPSGPAGGDLAGTYPSPTVTTDAITNAKLANVATATFKGRTTAGTGDPEDLTATQATALLNAMVGDSGSGGTKGLVPAPAAGDATKVLSGAGTYIASGGAPSGSAGGDLAGTYPNPTVKTSVSLTTPNINVATATSVNKVVLTAPATSATLTIADGKTLTASNTLTLAGTDSTTMTFPPASASVGYLNVPQNSQSTAYTTVLADSGKHLLHPSADTTARTFTIDSNANVAYPIGTAITIVNQKAGGVITIAITSDTMRLAGAGTTGSRTLAANGIATALKLTSTEWIISGTGLT